MRIAESKAETLLQNNEQATPLPLVPRVFWIETAETKMRAYAPPPGIFLIVAQVRLYLFDNVIQLSYKNNMILFDASTLILLAKIEMLDIFLTNAGRKVTIPEKVKEEVLTGSSLNGPMVAKLVQDRRIEVLKTRDRKLVRRLMEDFNIDEGEAEMLTLAIQEKALLLATDDKNAIKACKIMKLEFTTAIAILVRACEKGLIKADEALFKLQKLQSFARYNKTIIETARNQIEGAVKYGKKNDKHTNG